MHISRESFWISKVTLMILTACIVDMPVFEYPNQVIFNMSFWRWTLISYWHLLLVSIQKGFFGMLKASHFSIWRFFEGGPRCQTKTCSHMLLFYTWSHVWSFARCHYFLTFFFYGHTFPVGVSILTSSLKTQVIGKQYTLRFHIFGDDHRIIARTL